MKRHCNSPHKIGVTLLLAGLFYPLINCVAQDREIDSLRKILSGTAPDSVRTSALNYMSFKMFQQGRLEQSDSLAQKALLLAQKIGNNKQVALSYNNIANTYLDKGDYSNSLIWYRKALDINVLISNAHGIQNTLNNMGDVYLAEGDNFNALEQFNSALKLCVQTGDKRGEAIALENIGACFRKQAIYPRALDSCFKALEIRESIHDSEGIGNSFKNIGSIYMDIGNYPKALENINKALEIKKREGFLPDIADLYMNIGEAMQQQKNFPEAEERYSDALKLYEQVDNAQGIPICYLNIGDAKKELQKYDEALADLNKALELFQKIGNNEGVTASLQDIGTCYYFLKNYDKALDYETKARELAKSAGALEIEKESVKRLSDIYESKNDVKNALAFYKDYFHLNDSIYNLANSKKTAHAELAYEFETKEAVAKAEQEKKDALTQAEIKKKNTFLLLIIAIALALGIIATLILRSLRVTRKQKIQIERQKEIVERQKVIVEVKNKEILDSITYAKRLQDAILPPTSLVAQYLPESFVLYKPKDIVAGDFYWMEREGDVVLIAACDCTGHGVPGALVSVVCSNALNRSLKEFKLRNTGEILDKARELVLETFEKSGEGIKDGMDASFCAINLKTLEAEWSGAYNPLWYIRDNKLTEISADKQPIGKFDTPKPFKTHRFALRKGDLICLFTDGFSDQFGGPKGKKFKYKQLEEKLLSICNRKLSEQYAELEKVFDDWKGSLEQVDDVLIIGIRV